MDKKKLCNDLTQVYTKVCLEHLCEEKRKKGEYYESYGDTVNFMLECSEEADKYLSEIIDNSELP